MSKKIEVSPCPHCGKPGEFREVTKPHRHGWIGCPHCKIYKQWNISPDDAVEVWNSRMTVVTGMYDREELHHDCTVQVLTNTVTGEQSIGWWPNEEEIE